MGVLRNRHGTYVVRKKVPNGHEEAVARVLADGRSRVSWLQRSLGTKDLRTANTAAMPVLMAFDATLAKAAALLSPTPRRESLSASEIAVMAEYHYASMLGEDEDVRRDGSGSEQVYQEVAKQFAELGIAAATGFDRQPTPAFGMSEREVIQNQQSVLFVLPAAKAALARGDISFVEEELDELMEVYRFNLDTSSLTYRSLGAAVLRRHVQALEAIGHRSTGEVIDTPRLVSLARMLNRHRALTR